MFDRKPAQLDLLARSDIGKAFAKIPADFTNGAKLGSVTYPIGDADAHHEVAGGLAPKKNAQPFESFSISFTDRLPSLLGIAGDVLENIESVFLSLVLFDFIHRCLQKTKGATLFPVSAFALFREGDFAFGKT
jgi:hypothetical protein